MINIVEMFVQKKNIVEIWQQQVYLHLDRGSLTRSFWILIICLKGSRIIPDWATWTISVVVKLNTEVTAATSKWRGS